MFFDVKGEKNDRQGKSYCNGIHGYCDALWRQTDIFYEYVSEKLGRPIWTHEFINQDDTIKELSKEDFLGLCAGKPYPMTKLGKGAKQNG